MCDNMSRGGVEGPAGTANAVATTFYSGAHRRTTF